MSKYILINSNELQYYLKDLRKIPVISHKRQDEIFRLLQKCDDLDNETIIKLKEEILLGNLRFVVTVAKLYQGKGLDLLDLISEGNLGLMKAIDRYDYNSGVRFISYGVWWIRQSILSSLNEYSRTIRVPSNIIQDCSKKIKSATTEEGSKILANNINKMPICVGLNDEIDSDGHQLIDIVRDPNEQSPEILLNSKDEIKRNVDQLLHVLDQREKVIIEKYFGLNGIESSLEDLGEEFKCTKERIRQIKDRAMKKLRNDSYYLFKYL